MAKIHMQPHKNRRGGLEAKQESCIHNNLQTLWKSHICLKLTETVKHSQVPDSEKLRLTADRKSDQEQSQH